MAASDPHPGRRDRGPADSDGFGDYADYLRLLRQVDELVVAFDDHPDESTRERLLALLTSIDLLHRTALTRLVTGLRDHGAGAALDRVARDRVVETLLALYDLAELDVPDDLPDHAHEQDPASTVVFVPRDQLTLGRHRESDR
jgi:hypothetical protein